MDWTVEQSGALKEPPAKISRLMKKNVSTAINDSIRPALDLVRGPIPKGKSGLFQAIKQKRATIAQPEGKIDARHWLLQLVEEKTSAHVIRAHDNLSHQLAGVGRQALRFPYKGKIIFAKQVNHPGTRGKYSWKAGYEFIQRVMPTSIQQAVDAAINGQDYSSGPKVYTNQKTSIPLAFNPLSK